MTHLKNMNVQNDSDIDWLKSVISVQIEGKVTSLNKDRKLSNQISQNLNSEFYLYFSGSFWTKRK